MGLFICMLLFLGTSCSKDDLVETGENSKLAPIEINIKLVDNQQSVLAGEAKVIISKPRPDVNMLVARDEFAVTTGTLKYTIFTETALRITVLKPGYNPVYQDLVLKAETQDVPIVLTPKSGLTVLSYNVLEGFQFTNPTAQASNMDEFQKWVSDLDPDIVVFQEMNGFTEAKLKDFAKTYGHDHAVLLKDWGFPTAITAKKELEDVQRIEVPSNVSGYRVHGYIYAKTHGIDLFAIHLSSQSNDLVVHEAKEILAHIDRLPDNSRVMIAGDFNSISRQDEEFLGSNFWLNNLKKYRPGRLPTNYIAIDLFSNAGYVDAQRINNSYYKPSFPVKSDYLSSDFLGIRLDYVYLSDQLANQCDYVEILHDTYTNGASDHYPYLLHFDTDQ